MAAGMRSTRLCDELTAAAASKPVQEPIIRVLDEDGYSSEVSLELHYVSRNRILVSLKVASISIFTI